MPLRRISGGSPFEEEVGYSRAVVQGGWCFLSGTTGYDYATMTMPDCVVEQAANCIGTIEHILSEAELSRHDIVRVRYTLTDAGAVERVAPVLGRWLRDVRPAATMVIAGLIRPEMKIEIEVTAFRG